MNGTITISTNPENGRSVQRTALAANTVLAYLALGLSGAMLGPSLPTLAARWGISTPDAGVLFTALFLTACVAVAGAGALLDRIGRKPPMVVGLAALALGMSGMADAPSLTVGLLAAATLGIGWGCLDVAINLVVGDLYPQARGPALNLMNTAFGVGALVAPQAISWAIGNTGTPAPAMLALAAAGALAALGYVLLHLPPPLPHDAPTEPSTMRHALRDRHVIVTALLFFLYVGLEVSGGGWLYTFALHSPALPASAAAWLVTAYWLAMTVGRAAAGGLAHYVPEPALVWGGALVSMAGAALVAVGTSSEIALFAGALLMGAGFAPIFPTAFGLVTARHPAVAGFVSSLLVFGGTFGGAVLPYLTGQLFAVGGVPLAAGSMAVVCGVIAAVQVWLRRA